MSTIYLKAAFTGWVKKYIQTPMTVQQMITRLPVSQNMLLLIGSDHYKTPMKSFAKLKHMNYFL